MWVFSKKTILIFVVIFIFLMALGFSFRKEIEMDSCVNIYPLTGYDSRGSFNDNLLRETCPKEEKLYFLSIKLYDKNVVDKERVILEEKIAQKSEEECNQGLQPSLGPASWCKYRGTRIEGYPMHATVFPAFLDPIKYEYGGFFVEWSVLDIFLDNGGAEYIPGSILINLILSTLITLIVKLIIKLASRKNKEAKIFLN